jgi:hypothetical protein
MKYKKFIIYAILIIVSAIGGFFVRWHFFENDILTYAETARLTEDGPAIDIFTTNEESGTFTFLFQRATCKDSCVFEMLTVSNPAVDFPTYRIERGVERDWLVVTTLEMWGTGLRTNKDTWYSIDDYDKVHEALSYRSFSRESYSTTYDKMTTEVSIVSDMEVDIIYTTENCHGCYFDGMEECEEVCETEIETKHYVLDGDSFVLSSSSL